MLLAFSLSIKYSIAYMPQNGVVDPPYHSLMARERKLTILKRCLVKLLSVQRFREIYAFLISCTPKFATEKPRVLMVDFSIMKSRQLIFVMINSKLEWPIKNCDICVSSTEYQIVKLEELRFIEFIRYSDPVSNVNICICFVWRWILFNRKIDLGRIL